MPPLPNFIRLPLLLCCLSLGTPVQTQAQAQAQAPAPPKIYRDLIARYESYPSFGIKDLELLLVMPGQPGREADGVIVAHRSLTRMGEGYDGFVDSMGAKGSPMVPFTPLEMARVHALLAQLPEDRVPGDRGVLPPEGRRLVLLWEKEKGGERLIRIYDRARLPQPLLTIARMWQQTWASRPLTLDHVVPPDRGWQLSQAERDQISGATVGNQLRAIDSQRYLKLWTAPDPDFPGVAPGKEEARVMQVAYSPDSSRVAVVTAERSQRTSDPRSVFRVRVWKTEGGALASEMSAGEANSFDGVAKVLWSPDGGALLGAVNLHDRVNGYEVMVWEPNSGRLKGVLDTGGPTIEGMALLPDGRLVVENYDHLGHSWDLAAALKEIGEFEGTTH